METGELYSLYLQHPDICTDSRKIKQGCLFFALRGASFDGNDFAREALEKGAARVVVDSSALPRDERVVKVQDALAALQQLATYHRKKTRMTVIALTGSNGKTTTKDLCRAVLGRKYRTAATEGNLNNHIGVPLTLLSMNGNTEAGIVEMGANHPGEISRLCDMAQPDMGIITTIGKAHLEGFGDIEGVTKAKGELFDYLSLHGGLLLVNRGDERISLLAEGREGRKIYYNGAGGLQAEAVRADPFLSFEAVDGQRRIHFSTRLAGRYNVANVLAACCLGIHLGVPDEEIAGAVNAYVPDSNRSQYIRTERNEIYMDAYNANPTSMRAAIDEFLSSGRKKKLLILGEMKELGDHASMEHIIILRYLKEKGMQEVICVGKAFCGAVGDTGYRHFEEPGELMQYLKDNPPAGRYIFVKGSRSNQLENLLPLL